MDCIFIKNCFIAAYYIQSSFSPCGMVIVWNERNNHSHSLVLLHCGVQKGNYTSAWARHISNVSDSTKVLHFFLKNHPF